ncbi:hypothetical protein A4R26_08120 [Niastella populi]|uniref:Uncharacterized protein n=2 Tax=Niastella populi TaxID=550983 RepID=A0A1V9EL51_9BACT|nr:hypothetical protein A4R26_08120 [Niastella populi]
MNMHSLLFIGLLLQIITIGRLTSIVTGLISLTSVIIGRQALIRSSHPVSSRPKAIFALVMGLLGVLAGALQLILSNGGFGTGSGKLGAIVAMAIGLTGSCFGWLALNRSKRIANTAAANTRK